MKGNLLICIDSSSLNHIGLLKMLNYLLFRFIVPKEEFMYLNRKQENGITTEMVLPLKRKYTKKSDMIDLGSQKMKDKLLPPSVKRRVQ